ncbi:MAG: tetratricopeptide repeat protein [Thermoguttaceae bacterium]|jgi:tetratricopeptide (TPR) repeat protein
MSSPGHSYQSFYGGNFSHGFSGVTHAYQSITPEHAMNLPGGNNGMAAHSQWNEHPGWNQFRANNWAWNERWRGGEFANAFWRYRNFFFPWWDLGFGWWYPYYYSNFWNYYPYWCNGAVDYATYPYYSYVSPIDYQVGYQAEQVPQAAAAAGAFHTQGLEAFQAGEYRNALKLAAHAAIDDPQNPSVHLLLSLSMFAMGNYDGAAMEAHALAAMGKTPDWNTLYSFYGDVTKFTDQVRALEKDVGQHASLPTSRFLLGFLYLSEGHKEAARTQLLKALTLAPHDRVAANLLVTAGGQVPANIAEELKHAPALGQAPTPGAAPVPPPAPGGVPAGPAVPPPPPTK